MPLARSTMADNAKAAGYRPPTPIARNSSMTHDNPWAPRHEPARRFYLRLASEMTLRKSRPDLAWVTAEREAMWQEARDYAQQHGLQVPPLADIERAERMATGHVDYAAKFSLYVSEALHARAESR